MNKSYVNICHESCSNFALVSERSSLAVMICRFYNIKIIENARNDLSAMMEKIVEEHPATLFYNKMDENAGDVHLSKIKKLLENIHPSIWYYQCTH